jgi:hypothetical protein
MRTIAIADDGSGVTPRAERDVVAP